VYAKYDVDVTELEKITKILSERWKIKLTLTTLLSWAWARAMGDNPLANAIVRDGELKPLPYIKASTVVSLPKSDQVWPVVIDKADQLDLEQYAQALKQTVYAIREKKEKELDDRWLPKVMPVKLLKWMLGLFTTLRTDWGFDLTWLGVENEPFQPSSFTCTSVGMFDMDDAFATFAPFQPVPFVVAIGTARWRPWVIEKENTQQIVPRRIVPFCLTADHRVIDGKLGSLLWMDFKKHLSNFTKEYEHLIPPITSNNTSMPIVQSKL
jgi:pyruvate/2-oxoglutarate dehydrogenase complex dihydrolipoamide acyltransferase (E2) component